MLSETERDRLRTAFGEAGGLGECLTSDLAADVAMATGLALRKVEYFALEKGVVPERYDRNMGTLGLDGQRRLIAACAAVVGLGGLGGAVVEALARLGVGRIVGMDPDVFVESDLNRQLLSTVENLGESKARQAALRAALINPAVEFIPHAATFQSLPEQAFGECDLVFDCLDSTSARRELSARCASAGVVMVHGAIAGWCGQVAVCMPDGDIMEKALARSEHGVEQQLGTPPFTAIATANLMVAKAVALLLGLAPPSGQELLFFDLLNGDWQVIPF